MVPFVALAAVVASAVLPAAGAGCRARTRADAPAPRGVGFELPGGGVVTRGALLTDPPGREEAFVALVAGAASAWVEACRAEAAPHELSQFSFETDGDGARPLSSLTRGRVARTAEAPRVDPGVRRARAPRTMRLRVSGGGAHAG